VSDPHRNAKGSARRASPGGADGRRPTPGTARERRALHAGVALAVTILVVGGVVAAVHWPVLGAQALSLDDRDYVIDNPLVTHPSWTSVGRFFGEVLRPSTIPGYYFPLSMTSLMLGYAMGGRPEDLGAYHRMSLALHVLNAMLIVLLLYRLFGTLIPAGIAGLIFGLHPLTVEPTAWIGEQKTLLAAFFALGCLLCYLRCVRGGGRAWTFAAVALYLLALLSKPTVVMLPLLMLLIDYWPLRRLSIRTVAEKWPFLVLSIVSGIITVVSHGRTAGITQSDYVHWPLRACYVLAFYLAKMIWPARLSSVYEAPEPFVLSNPVVLVGAASVCALTVCLALMLRRTRGPMTGWLFFVIALAPTLGLINYSWVIASDKYLYIAIVGILMVIAAGLDAAWRALTRRGLVPRAALVVLLVVILGGEAHAVRGTLRNWTDSITLARHMARVAPGSALIQTRLGALLEEKSEHGDAMRALRRAVEIDPSYGLAHFNLAVALTDEGRIDEAIEHYRKALALRPDYVPTLCNLGSALRRAGKMEEAEAMLRRAVRLEPSSVEALDQLGRTLMLENRTAEGVEEFRRAVAVAPDNPDLRYWLSMALMRLGGRDAEVAANLRRSIRVRPTWPEALNALAWLLATSPDSSVFDPGEARRLASRAVELTGGRDPRMLDTLAAALAAAGQFDEAVRNAREAVRLASESSADTVGAGIRNRLKLYERRVAYRERVASP
jgi:Flp pilus assembly protein TadD